MRRLILYYFFRPAFIAALAISLSSCGTANRGKTYVDLSQMPDAGVYLPAPPAENTVEFLADSARYEWGKTVRGTARGEQAVRDAKTGTDYFMEIFAEPLGVLITKDNAPFLYDFLARSIRTIRLGVTKAKDKYMRLRPFVHFGEPTAVPGDEEELRGTGSYPSGHTVRGWGLALLLSEICPEHQDAILQRGYDYGESRVIVGFHYQSDVNAARSAAAASVSRMHADKTFMKDLARAKKEFRKISH